jgi:hypothetical protein
MLCAHRYLMPFLSGILPNAALASCWSATFSRDRLVAWRRQPAVVRASSTARSPAIYVPWPKGSRPGHTPVDEPWNERT